MDAVENAKVLGFRGGHGQAERANPGLAAGGTPGPGLLGEIVGAHHETGEARSHRRGRDISEAEQRARGLYYDPQIDRGIPDLLLILDYVARRVDLRNQDSV